MCALSLLSYAYVSSESITRGPNAPETFTLTSLKVFLPPPAKLVPSEIGEIFAERVSAVNLQPIPRPVSRYNAQVRKNSYLLYSFELLFLFKLLLFHSDYFLGASGQKRVKSKCVETGLQETNNNYSISLSSLRSPSEVDEEPVLGGPVTITERLRNENSVDGVSPDADDDNSDFNSDDSIDDDANRTTTQRGMYNYHHPHRHYIQRRY